MYRLAPSQLGPRQVKPGQVILLSVGLMVTLPVLADGSDKVPLFQARDKSTLETFPLQSLEPDDLSNAAIGGTLDVPAAGTEDPAAQVMELLPKEIDTPQDLSDMGRYNVPATINVKAQPVALEGRTYSWDFETTRR